MCVYRRTLNKVKMREIGPAQNTSSSTVAATATAKAAAATSTHGSNF